MAASADAGLADQHRVVLRPPRQHLDDPPDLLVPPDDRVELAGPGLGGQVATVLLECLIRGLGIGRGDPLAAADALEGTEDRLPAGLVGLEEGLALPADLGNPEEEVLCRDVFVAETPGLLLGELITRVARRSMVSERPGPGPPGEGGRERPRNAGRSTRAGGASRRDPVVGLHGAASRCSASRTGPRGWGQLLGAMMASGPFGESIELHRWFTRCGVAGR
jgi:hypothetical protein